MRNKRRLMNSKVVRLREGAVMAYFKVLSQLFSGGTVDTMQTLVRIVSLPDNIETGNILNTKQE
jgi:hypothetical protein